MKYLLPLLLACSSRPTLDVAVDAGSECRECWSLCGHAASDRAARYCSEDCNRLCAEEAVK